MENVWHIIVAYAIPFIFTLGLLVLVHELGHFSLAKLVGIRVERFSVGFPPRLFGKKIGDTDYCVSAVPIGGYVKMSGMIDESLDESSVKGEPWEFMSKPIWARFLVIFAGPMFNILLAVLLYTGIVMTSGISVTVDPNYAIVGEVMPDTPAASIGLQPGDRITRIDGQAVEMWQDLINIVHKVPEQEIFIEWVRGGEQMSASVTTMKDLLHEIGLIGIAPVTELQKVGVLKSFWYGTLNTVDKTVMIFKSFGLLFSGKVPAKEALAGPIKIAEMTGEVAERGFIALLSFAAILSINLGLLNLLPIPVLDGGHLVLLTIEGVTRRPISNKIKMAVQQVGMALLLALMVFVIINDFLRIGQ
ncbi:RIP metalloprotease RseP [candidate division KSB1 bacterium]|nr:RIP metalloprotease RseP [candidate division KSB1 bacterium]RQW07540.1 MAG: RIP metalloprotease RseP [candidate division KSB1 bacterium]